MGAKMFEKAKRKKSCRLLIGLRPVASPALSTYSSTYVTRVWRNEVQNMDVVCDAPFGHGGSGASGNLRESMA